MYTIQNEKNSTNLLPKNSTTMINNLLYPAHNTKTFNSRIMFQFLENVIGTKKKDRLEEIDKRFILERID